MAVPYTVFLSGGIASGKSTVSRRMEELGAWRCDLDALSREVLSPGSPVLDEVAAAFGDDLIDPGTGELDRGLLASRAFADPEALALLERIEVPAIMARLAAVLCEAGCGTRAPRACVVEVQVLDRAQEWLDLADEVMVVTCPADVRRRRAVARGMDPVDFDARMANQATDEWLAAHADTVLVNDGTREELVAQVDAWWSEREASGWAVRQGSSDR